MAPVRAHRKSRKGCRTCKSRKVKCDETNWPRCKNCERRDVECDWPEHLAPSEEDQQERERQQRLSTPSPPLQSEIVPQAPPPHVFDMSTMELLHHYSTDTYACLLEGPGSANAVHSYQVIAPKMALTHPQLMHSILSLASLHLHCLNKDKLDTRDYYSLSLYHRRQSRGYSVQVCADGQCPGGTHTCTQVASAKFLADILSSVYSFCEFTLSIMPTRSEQLDLVINWLEQQRATVLNFFPSHRNQLMNGPLSDLLRMSIAMQQELPSEVDAIHSASLPAALLSIHVPFVGALDSNELSEPGIPEIYRDSVRALERACSLFSHGCRLRALFNWPSVFPQRYVSLLRERRPRALVILAHFCSVYQRARAAPDDRQFWWSCGQNDYIMLIRSMLDVRWQSYLDECLSAADGTSKVLPMVEGTIGIDMGQQGWADLGQLLALTSEPYP